MTRDERRKPTPVGERFGRLVITGDAEDYVKPNGKRLRRVTCRCDCGGELVTRLTRLRRGTAESCGCLMRERTADAHRTHGLSDTPTYVSWTHMVNRCTNPDSDSWPSYGGRGYRVCDRWNPHVVGPAAAMTAFLADMGERPPGHDIDRIDPDGDYTPENCRWLVASENRGRARYRVDA